MRKTTILLIAIVLIFGVFIAGCSPSENGEPSERTSDEKPLDSDSGSGASDSLPVPQVQGIVQEVEQGDNTRVLVDSDAEVKGLIWVTIDDDTDFFEDVEPDSSIGVSNVSRDFKAGNKVAFFVGAVMESYPMQTTARACYENSSE